MPFKSKKQRIYMHMKHPKIAKQWENKYKNGGIMGWFDKIKDKDIAVNIRGTKIPKGKKYADKSPEKRKALLERDKEYEEWKASQPQKKKEGGVVKSPCEFHKITKLLKKKK